MRNIKSNPVPSAVRDYITDRTLAGGVSPKCVMKENISHTPGPWAHWKVTIPFLGWEILDSTKNRCGVARLTAVRPEDEANARLIAAAPELLEACQFALECCQSLPGKSNHPLAVKCRAAIAKAKA